MDYKEYDKYDYLVIESRQGKHYGFNLNVMKERSLARKIVSPDDGDDCMVLGWKVAKKLPQWSHNADSWIDVINRNDDKDDAEEESNANEKEEHPGNNEEEQEEDDDYKDDNDNDKKVEEMEDEEEGRTSEDEYDNDEHEDNEKKVEVMEEKKEGTYDDDDKDDTSDEEVEVKLVNHVLCESAERLPFRGGKPWQGEQEDSIPSPDRKKPPPKKLKIKNEGLKEMNSTKFDNNYEDASIFDFDQWK